MIALITGLKKQSFSMLITSYQVYGSICFSNKTIKCVHNVRFNCNHYLIEFGIVTVILQEVSVFCTCQTAELNENIVEIATPAPFKSFSLIFVI
jgi:hypothetical protein